MIEEQAYIVATEPNLLTVEINQKSSCSSCSAQTSCGTSALSQLFGQRPSQFKLDVANETIDGEKLSNVLKAGDLIIIGLDDLHYLKASALIYLLPLMTLFGFALVADQIFAANDIVVTLFAALGLWLGFKWSAFQAQHSKKLITPQFINRI